MSESTTIPTANSPPAHGARRRLPGARRRAPGAALGARLASRSEAPGRCPAARSAPTRRSRRRSCVTSRRRWTCATSRTSSSSGRGAIRGGIPSRWELATAYLGLVPLGIDPRVPADTRWHRRRRAAGDRVRPRRDRPGRPRATARQALVLEPRLRARTRHVHARGASRRVRGRARLRRLRDEPEACAAPSRRDRADRRAPRPGLPAGVLREAFRFRSRQLEVTDPFAVLRPPRLRTGPGFTELPIGR